jgi:HD-GYP domain-containing protein (c-di-GMP phosphodiesterase class II)
MMGQYNGDDLAARSLESSLLAMAIGIEMGLDAENISNLGVAGLVHDWGMMQVPLEIRTANRKLNQVEMLEIKKHPIHSLEILQRVSALPRVVSLISYQVHEKVNGNGYPRGRRGNSIHQFARILQVADAYTGMTSQRPYRPPMMRYAAMECLLRMAKEKSVDPDVVRALLKIQSLFPIGSFVILSNSAVAQVIRRNQDKYTQPIVRVLQDSEGNPANLDDDSTLIDLSDSELTVQQAMPAPGTNEVPLCEDYYSTCMDVKK